MSTFEDYLSLDQAAKKHVARARDFARSVIAPNAAQWSESGGTPASFFIEAAGANLCGLLVPQDLGGAGLDKRTLVAIAHALAEQCFASTFSLIVHNNLAANIALNGQAHHHAVLGDMVAGKKVGAFLLTEPDVGSDATAIKTEAQKTENGWLINGRKAWVTNGAIASLFSVYAQSSPQTDQPAHGIVNFLVDSGQTPIVRSDRYDILGGQGMNVCGIELNGIALDDQALMIGTGEAFKAAMQGIDLARTVVAAMSCGMIKEALKVAIRAANNRLVFGQAVFNFQSPQNLLADAATDLEAASLLTAKAATTLDNEGSATLAAAHAKKFATRAAMKRIADCMQAMGANGLRRDYSLARHLECAKISEYVDGTTEIQNVVIGRHLKKQSAI